MKKLLAIIFAGLLILSCTVACNKAEDTDAATEHTHAHTHSAETETSEVTVPAATATEAPQETKAPAQEPETKPDDSSAVLTRGSFSGSKYTNNVLGLYFTLPAGWEFFADADVAALSGLSADSLKNFDATAQTSPAVYDMYAVDKNRVASVSLCYENMLLTTGSILSAREYLNVIEDAVAGAGISEIVDKGTVTFCGDTYESATITSGEGSTKNLKTYYLKNIGNYMVTIIITTDSTTAEADVISMFG